MQIGLHTDVFTASKTCPDIAGLAFPASCKQEDISKMAGMAKLQHCTRPGAPSSRSQ